MIAESQWSQSETRGNVRDITYENIKVLGGELPAIHFQGFDEEHTVENVEISGLEILGNKITDIKSGKFYLGDFIKNISVK